MSTIIDIQLTTAYATVLKRAAEMQHEVVVRVEKARRASGRIAYAFTESAACLLPRGRILHLPVKVNLKLPRPWITNHDKCTPTKSLVTLPRRLRSGSQALMTSVFFSSMRCFASEKSVRSDESGFGGVEGVALMA